MVGQGYGDGNTLLLAARKLGELVMLALIQSDQVEQFVGTAALVVGEAGDGHGQHRRFLPR